MPRPSSTTLIHCATHEFNFPDCAADLPQRRRHRRQVHPRTFPYRGPSRRRAVRGRAVPGLQHDRQAALDDPRNSLVHHFVRLVVDLKASYFVFENVRGLTIGPHRKFLEEIIREFRKSGYRVLEDYRVLNAAHHGVPQNRQRLFLMGARKGFPLPEYPEATHEVNSEGRCRRFISSIDADRMGCTARHSRGRRLRGTAAPGLGEGAVQESRPITALPYGATKPIPTITPCRANSTQACSRPACAPSIRICRRSVSRNATRRHRAREPVPQTRSQGRLQHDSRRDGQRSWRIHVAAADTSLFAALHHRARGGAPPLLSGLVPLSRHEVARLPADWQFGAAVARARRGLEGARSLSRHPRSPTIPSPRATPACCRSVCLQPPRITACRPMSFRKRIRSGQGAEANG